MNTQEDITFGKNGWKQILNNIEIQDAAAIFQFKPAPGEVLDWLKGDNTIGWTPPNIDFRQVPYQEDFLRKTPNS